MPATVTVAVGADLSRVLACRPVPGEEGDTVVLVADVTPEASGMQAEGTAVCSEGGGVFRNALPPRLDVAGAPIRSFALGALFRPVVVTPLALVLYALYG